MLFLKGSRLLSHVGDVSRTKDTLEVTMPDALFTDYMTYYIKAVLKFTKL